MIEYESFISDSSLNDEDKQFFLQDEQYSQRYKQMVKEGWIFKDISVEEIEEKRKVPASKVATTVLKNGKIVRTEAYHPTSSKTYYNNKLYATAQSVLKLAKIASSFIPNTVISWAASSVLSIPAGQFTAFFNDGYQKTEENGTMHIKDAYYKSKGKYFLGYSVSSYDFNFSVLVYYRDTGKRSHQNTKSFNREYYSPNYTKGNAILIQYAEKYYNKGWKSEYPSYPHNIQLK